MNIDPSSSFLASVLTTVPSPSCPDSQHLNTPSLLTTSFLIRLFIKLVKGDMMTPFLRLLNRGLENLVKWQNWDSNTPSATCRVLPFLPLQQTGESAWLKASHFFSLVLGFLICKMWTMDSILGISILFFLAVEPFQVKSYI